MFTPASFSTAEQKPAVFNLPVQFVLVCLDAFWDWWCKLSDHTLAVLKGESWAATKMNWRECFPHQTEEVCLTAIFCVGFSALYCLSNFEQHFGHFDFKFIV